MSFDPNAAAAVDSGVFGLLCSEKESTLVYIPVPWEATTSYGGGTANGPRAILEASHQVDLFDYEVFRPYEPGLYMLEESSEIRQWNEEAKAHARLVIEAAGNIDDNPELRAALHRVNALGERLNDSVRETTQGLLAQGKIAAVVGGDHSTPFGALQAVAERYPSFGVLHFDAHSDTRQAFEGFVWSHASIFHNVLERIPQVTQLVQVGIRDFCEEEWEYCRSQGKRVKVFFDADLSQSGFDGTPWTKSVDYMISSLPKDVWVSFDIDGLDPRFCPHTGTPVPGGLDFNQAIFVISSLVRSGRRIIGFDLNEVAPDPRGESEWDANVGARLLYKLSAWTLVSQGKVKLHKR